MSDECANCGDPGHPGHHWMDDPGVYVCFHRPDLTEDAPPPVTSSLASTPNEGDPT